MISPDRHDFCIDIDRSDIDFMGHVNNAVYLKWVQAAVIAHWRRVAPPAAIETYLWIALRHEIIYRRPAFLGDELIARVRLEKVQRESAFYQTTFHRGVDVIVEVESRWCCIDARDRSPARVTDEITRCFFPEATP